MLEKLNISITNNLTNEQTNNKQTITNNFPSPPSPWKHVTNKRTEVKLKVFSDFIQNQWKLNQVIIGSTNK